MSRKGATKQVRSGQTGWCPHGIDVRTHDSRPVARTPPTRSLGTESTQRRWSMKCICIQRQRGRRERPWPDVLALDPRDPGVVRAKTIGQSRDRQQKAVRK
jgi:hypothetical protein